MRQHISKVASRKTKWSHLFWPTLYFVAAARVREVTSFLR